MLLAPVAASAQNLVAPEIVQLENLLDEGEMKTVYVGNDSNRYFLYCHTKAPLRSRKRTRTTCCSTPIPVEDAGWESPHAGQLRAGP